MKKLVLGLLVALSLTTAAKDLEYKNKVFEVVVAPNRVKPLDFINSVQKAMGGVISVVQGQYILINEYGLISIDNDSVMTLVILDPNKTEDIFKDKNFEKIAASHLATGKILN